MTGIVIVPFGDVSFWPLADGNVGTFDVCF